MIQSTDIKIMESTGLLGGAITAVEIADNELHNVFPQVSSDQALIGLVDYACIYVKNGHGSLTLEDAEVFINAQTPSPSTKIEMGLGTSAIGTSEQVIPDSETAPTGVVFTELTGEGNSEIIGNLSPSNYKAIWLKRTVNAGTTALSNDTFSIQIIGNTGA